MDYEKNPEENSDCILKTLVLDTNTIQRYIITSDNTSIPESFKLNAENIYKKDNFGSGSATLIKNLLFCKLLGGRFVCLEHGVPVCCPTFFP